MKTIRGILVAAFLTLGMVSLALGQTTTTSTTLSAAATATETTIAVASATGFTAGTTAAYVDNEQMYVTAVSGTTITVARGMNGTRAVAHTSGEVVWVGPRGAGPFVNFQKHGSCTSSSELYLPQIHTPSGAIGRCTNSEWAWSISNYSGLQTKADLHMILDTTTDERAVRINTRSYSTTAHSGTSLGFQSNPAQAITITGTIQGGEIIPRVNDGIAVANIIGLKVSAYLKGTSAGAISGDVRGLQVEMITDVGGTRTIGGDVSAIRIRSNITSGTITGAYSAIRLLTPEGTKVYDAVLKLDGAVSGAWGSNTDSGDTEGGYISVLTDFDGNGTFTKMYLVLYSDAPTL